MSLKLTPDQAAEVKAAVRVVEAASEAVKHATDTGSLKAALNRLWFATRDASEVADRMEREANALRMEKAA
jgi:hypothetical protein